MREFAGEWHAKRRRARRSVRRAKRSATEGAPADTLSYLESALVRSSSLFRVNANLINENFCSRPQFCADTRS
jgi:hypothetical protein